ncbi:hypothetical protein SAMN04488523_106278 [Sulfitobacter brevis]|uniref:NrS-1 polymerase-like helicase domain-containing protein n=1 Tax=Sulfitobacter brevis TaxID=74348 RepID=A0A1I1ZXJ6_9RHOB|nr:DUF5906 domain-containing protein [Sulfitobacter brevis]SFE36138.1 hypothetical protein SAMN04488523_106278 [Sulfitobacter brevis]
MNTLASLYAGVQHGFISVICMSQETKRIVASDFFAVTDLAAAEEFSKTHAKINHVYYSFNVLRAEPAKGRGGEADFVASIGVFLDIDIRQNAANIHAADERLPGSLEEVMTLLEENNLPKPTSIVNSGNGYYFRYYFPEPILYPSVQERKRFLAAAGGFHEAFAKAWQSKGWKLDPVWDLARVTRMPGTLNHKTNPPKHVELVEHLPERTLSHGEFFKFAKKGSSVAAGGLPAVRRSSVVAGEGAAGSAKADFRSVVAACRAIRHLIENAAHLAYVEWFSLAGVLKHCENGEELFHQLSRLDPRYDAAEAAKTFTNATGPTSCRYFGLDLACSQCGGCPFAGNQHVGSPIAFGDLSKATAQLISNTVYATFREKFFELDSKQAYTKGNLNDQFARFMPKPAATLIGDKRMRIVHHADYFPGQVELFVENEGQISFNTWRPSELQREPGDVSIILEHFDYLVPDPDERRHVLDALAHSVQRPSEKIAHCVFFIGGQGTGKSWVSQLLMLVFGAHNVFVTDNQMLTSSFNAPMGNRQVLILEEVGLADKAEAYNTLKMWVTDEKVTVNEKNVPQYFATTPRLMLAYSNRDLPLKIEEGDRRFMFVQSPSTPRDAEYYTRLFEHGLPQAGAFLQWLFDRDISNFSAKARPPMTGVKRKIISESKPAVSRAIEDMLLEGEWPFNEEIFTLSDVMTEVLPRVPNNANRSPQEFAKVLQKSGFVPASKHQVRVGSYKYRFWTKAGSKWEGADSEFLKKQWEKQDKAA